MLRTLTVALAVAVLAGSAPAQITVVYNGSILRTSAPPVEVGSRVLVGMRDIFEAMSATLQWNAAARTVTATQGSTVVVLTINSHTAYVSGRAVHLDVAPQIIGSSTYVPLRFVAEASGADVQWVAATRTVTITTGAGPRLPPTSATTAAVPSPTVHEPNPGQTVGPSVDVKGRTIGGATIRIITHVYKKANDELVTKVPGIVHNVGADGDFDFNIAIPSNSRLGPPSSFYYDIHVWAVKDGQQSEPTVVRVYRND